MTRLICPIALLLIAGLGQVHAQKPPAVAARTREAVLKDYRENFVAAEITDVGWTGSTESCDPGTLAPSTYKLVLQQLNFFRRMAGYSTEATLDTTLYPQLQKTTLIMAANDKLSHRPDASWKCYSEDGATGARYSNVHLGQNAGIAIAGFMQDNGAGNVSAGHRRYILESKGGIFSFGAAGTAAALHVYGGYVRQNVPEIIAWPPAGYVPAGIVYDRWSFCLPEGKFDSATVTMQGPSGQVPLEIVSNDAVYGDPGVVWVPHILMNSNKDVAYTVRVTNIRDAAKKEYSYRVVIIPPQQ